jgi:hypothetical protein
MGSAAPAPRAAKSRSLLDSLIAAQPDLRLPELTQLAHAELSQTSSTSAVNRFEGKSCCLPRLYGRDELSERAPSM